MLARTTRLLRTVAHACVAPGIPINAPPEVFKAAGADEVIRAHLQLAAEPRHAEPQDVLTVMRHPSRGLLAPQACSDPRWCATPSRRRSAIAVSASCQGPRVADGHRLRL